MKVVGTIQDISSRSVAGNRTAYGIVIDGNNYSVGLYAPRGVAVGDNVEFEVEVNGQYRNVARGSLRKVYGAAATGVAPSATSPTSNFDVGVLAGNPKPFVSDTDRQSIISKQAALNTAISYVNVLLETESVPLPKTAADRLAFIESLVFDSTAKFHKFSTGNDVEIPEYVGAGGKKAAAKKAAAEEPAAEEEFHEDQIPF